MQRNTLSFSDAKKIPITDYLSSLGFEPARIHGIDYWYHSPFREERTPSFKVNARSNVWYDHGTGEGGTILDLGAKLHQCTLQEFLEKLSVGRRDHISFQKQQFPSETPKSKMEIISANPLTSPDLVHYLQMRGIDIETARKHCLQVEFRVGPRTYSAIGFLNRSGGYELRNRWFKGSSSPKDISLIKADSPRICVLEGFIDFLSVLRIDEPRINQLIHNSTFLILNSLRLVDRSLPIIKLHNEIHLFLDNDNAGKETRERLREKGICFQDASLLFGPHKDVNEYLIAKLKSSSAQHFPKENYTKIKR